MKVYTVEELFFLAKERSAFYKNLYKDVAQFRRITDLPVLKSEDFWRANTLEKNQVLTSIQSDGIVFKSGGTTGSPKFSFFSQAEWEMFTTCFGEGMRKGGLKDGETIANLFYAGDLYASFLFIMRSIEKSGAAVTHYPLGGGAEFSHIVETLNTFKITTWAGVPTSIMKLAEYALKNPLHTPNKILFGGESFYQDQIDFVKSVFPKTIIQSIGYASVDGGLLGYVDGCSAMQEHRVFSAHTVMEILDEDSLEPITEVGKPGKLYLTNLTRALMPIIRYPVGDNAMWMDSAATDRKFKILGRSEEGARVGPATVYYEDIFKLLSHFQDDIHLKGFQLLLQHFEGRDQLVVRIAAQNARFDCKSIILEYLYQERGALADLVDKKLIHPVKIEFVDIGDLSTNSRTGKMKRIIDQRA